MKKEKLGDDVNEKVSAAIKNVVKSAEKKLKKLTGAERKKQEKFISDTKKLDLSKIPEEFRKELADAIITIGNYAGAMMEVPKETADGKAINTINSAVKTFKKVGGRNVKKKIG